MNSSEKWTARFRHWSDLHTSGIIIKYYHFWISVCPPTNKKKTKRSSTVFITIYSSKTRNNSSKNLLNSSVNRLKYSVFPLITPHLLPQFSPHQDSSFLPSSVAAAVLELRIFLADFARGDFVDSPWRVRDLGRACYLANWSAKILLFNKFIWWWVWS